MASRIPETYEQGEHTAKRKISSYCTAILVGNVFGLRIPEKKIKQVIKLTAEGIGIRETGRQLYISKDTVNKIVLKTEKHCEIVLSNLLSSLEMSKSQIDTLLSFIENRKVLKK